MKNKKFIVLSLALLMVIGLGNVRASACMGSLYTCNKDYEDYKDEIETGTHNYGFLWRKTCTQTFYKASAKDQCFWCGEVYNYSVGPHTCYAEHTDCGSGKDTNWCPCEQLASDN